MKLRPELKGKDKKQSFAQVVHCVSFASDSSWYVRPSGNATSDWECLENKKNKRQ